MSIWFRCGIISRGFLASMGGLFYGMFAGLLVLLHL